MLDFKCVSLKIFFRKIGGKTKNCCAVVFYFSLMSGSEVMTGNNHSASLSFSVFTH